MHNRFVITTASIFIFLFSFADLILSQNGTYYNSITPSSSSFVTDLETRLRIPYTKISYDNFDETNIANFASFDNGNGTRSVFCVYSNFEYIYIGTFSWIPISRNILSVIAGSPLIHQNHCLNTQISITYSQHIKIVQMV